MFPIIISDLYIKVSDTCMFAYVTKVTALAEGTKLHFLDTSICHFFFCFTFILFFLINFLLHGNIMLPPCSAFCLVQ